MNWVKDWYARNTNPDKEQGSVHDVIKGADVFFGLSAPGLLTGDDVQNNGKGPDRFCDGKSDARDHARGCRGTCSGDGHRPFRLSKPDQQRTLLPGYFSRCSELPCVHASTKK